MGRSFILSLAIAVLLAGTAAAQGRVFTNDDIESRPPRSPATNRPAPGADAPATRQPQAENPPEAENPDEAYPLTDSAGLSAIQSALTEALNDMDARLERATVGSVIERWSRMRESLGELMVEYRTFTAEAARAERSRERARQNPAQ